VYLSTHLCLVSKLRVIKLGAVYLFPNTPSWHGAGAGAQLCRRSMILMLLERLMVVQMFKKLPAIWNTNLRHHTRVSRAVGTFRGRADSSLHLHDLFLEGVVLIKKILNLHSGGWSPNWVHSAYCTCPG
jgi:hypothetical protein